MIERRSAKSSLIINFWYSSVYLLINVDALDPTYSAAIEVNLSTNSNPPGKVAFAWSAFPPPLPMPN